MSNNNSTSRRNRSPLLRRDYLLLVAGQGCSLFGSAMLRFAMSMWVLDETGSATIFASVLAATIVPTILLSPFGGVLADRINRRNIMVALDACSGLFVMAATVWFAAIPGGASTDDSPFPMPLGFSLGAVTALMVGLSVLGAFETPTVQAALPQLLRGEGEATIRQGMAVINQVQQLSALLPSFIGGALYGLVGIGPMLMVTVVCFFGTAVFECFIRLDTPGQDGSETMTADATPRGGWMSDIRTALRFLVRERPNIFRLMLLAAAINLFAVGYSAVGFPFMIRTVLGFNATVYGVCDGIVGIAALVGMMLSGMFAARLTIDRMPSAMVAFGAAILPAGAAFLLPMGDRPVLVVLVASCCATGCACSFINIIAVPAIQIRTPEVMTGKVMSLVASFATCAQPLGQMLYGWLYDAVAPEWVLLGTAAAIIIIAAASAPLFSHFDE